MDYSSRYTWGPPILVKPGKLSQATSQLHATWNGTHRTIYPPPWWKLEATTTISQANKDETTKTHQQRLRQISGQNIILYTDGSGHNKHIGSATFSPTTNSVLNFGRDS